MSQVDSERDVMRDREEPRSRQDDRDYEREPRGRRDEGDYEREPRGRQDDRDRGFERYSPPSYTRKKYGSWDGRTSSIPGKINNDGTPDMRDAQNRETFLGESIGQRRRRFTSRMEDRGSYRYSRDERDERREGGADLAALDQFDETTVERLSESELILLGKKVTQLNHRLFEEIEHREMSASHRDSRDERSSPSSASEDIPRNQDGSPDLRYKENGGGSQGQGRVTSETDSRLAENRERGDRRSRDYDDRPTSRR